MVASGEQGISVVGWADAQTYMLDGLTAATALTMEPKPTLDEAVRKSNEALARD